MDFYKKAIFVFVLFLFFAAVFVKMIEPVVEKQISNIFAERKLSSKLVRLWVKLMIGLPFSDTQCGAKALRLDVWKRISPQIRERGWVFDLDFLNAAVRNEFSVGEIPVHWKHIAEGSKVRVIDAGKEVFFGSIRIRRRR